MTEQDKWLIEIFERRGPIPGDTSEEKLKVDFFAAKLIDSLGVIEIITEIEEELEIRFTETDFQDRRFSTIGGLGEIVLECLGREKRGG